MSTSVDLKGKSRGEKGSCSDWLLYQKSLAISDLIFFIFKMLAQRGMPCVNKTIAPHSLSRSSETRPLVGYPVLTSPVAHVMPFNWRP